MNSLDRWLTPPAGKCRPPGFDGRLFPCVIFILFRVFRGFLLVLNQRIDANLPYARYQLLSLTGFLRGEFKNVIGE